MRRTNYILGHSDEELRRLELQAAVLEPATLRLLRHAGLSEAMSVLDIGTGAGDVAMLAARLVGPLGRVVGVDRSAAALERARARAAWESLNWVEFEETPLAAATGEGGFDLVVGRYVLMHQPDPAAFLAAAATHVKPGGTLAFLEMAQTIDGRYSVPPVAAYDEAVGEILTAFAGANANLDVGSRLVGLFADARLREPSLVAETPVGGAGSALPEWIARTRRNVQSGPGLTGASWEALAVTIARDATACKSQLFGPRNVAAWVQI